MGNSSLDIESRLHYFRFLNLQLTQKFKSMDKGKFNILI